MWISREDYDKLVNAAGDLTSSNVRLEEAFREMEKISDEWQKRYYKVLRDGYMGDTE